MKLTKKLETIIIIKELYPIIETYYRSKGLNVYGKDIFPVCGEFTQNLIKSCLKEKIPELFSDVDIPDGNMIPDEIPMRPPVMCAGCPHRGVFYVLKKLDCMVYGDIGCYTLGAVAPLNAMDLNVCMGASCSGLHGFNLAMK